MIRFLWKLKPYIWARTLNSSKCKASSHNFSGICFILILGMCSFLIHLYRDDQILIPSGFSNLSVHTNSLRENLVWRCDLCIVFGLYYISREGKTYVLRWKNEIKLLDQWIMRRIYKSWMRKSHLFT